MRDAENTDGKKLHCSFCGKAQEEVKKLIAGPDLFICDECIGLCHEILHVKGPAVNFETSVKQNPLTPKEIYATLNDYIIGQDKAKKTLAEVIEKGNKSQQSEAKDMLAEIAQHENNKP